MLERFFIILTNGLLNAKKEIKTARIKERKISIIATFENNVGSVCYNTDSFKTYFPGYMRFVFG